MDAREKIEEALKALTWPLHTLAKKAEVPYSSLHRAFKGGKALGVYDAIKLGAFLEAKGILESEDSEGFALSLAQEARPCAKK